MSKKTFSTKIDYIAYPVILTEILRVGIFRKLAPYRAQKNPHPLAVVHRLNSDDIDGLIR